MSFPPSRLRGLLITALCSVVLLLSGCATTVDAPPPLPPGMVWEELPELPETIRQALIGSTLLEIEAKGDVMVPVRQFGAEGTRPPLLMVHGLQSHSGWFAQSAAFIASLGHPVYALDRRGSGMSSAPRGDSKDFMDWVDDIRAVFKYVEEQHDVEQVYLLGHCFGAIPATVYAQEYPDDLKGLILTTPGIFTLTSIPLTEAFKIGTTRSGQRDYHFPAPVDADQFSELDKYDPFIEADPLTLRTVTGDLYWQIHRARKHIRADADHLTMPLLVGLAGEDDIADNRQIRRWLSEVPAVHQTEMTYPDARHILEYSSERDLYFRDMRAWLAWIEAR